MDDTQPRTAAAPKKRGRPLGSKNAKKTGVTDEVTGGSGSVLAQGSRSNVASSLKKRTTRTAAHRQSLAVPSVAELRRGDVDQEDRMDMDDFDSTNDNGNHMQESINIDMSVLGMSVEQRTAHSFKILQDMTNNLYGLESLRFENNGNDLNHQEEAIHSNNADTLSRELIVESSSHVVGEDVWPSRTSFSCYHCRQPITGVPMRHCKSINWSENVKKFVLDGVWGWWHNPQCLRAYLEQTNVPNIGHELIIISRIIQLVLNMSMEETEGCAPPWQALMANNAGGYMSWDDFCVASKASSNMRITRISNNILIPSVVLYEITRSTTRTLQSNASVHTKQPLLPLLTDLGLSIDPETGALHDTSLLGASVLDDAAVQDKVWPKFRVSGYAFQAVYTKL